MNIFYLTSEFPWPPHHGGRVRSLAQLRLLCSLPEVDRVSVLGLSEDDPGQGADPTRRYDGLAEVVPKARILPMVPHPIHLLRHPLSLCRTAALRLFRGVPYLLGKWQSSLVEQALRRWLSDPFDVIYIDHLGMAVYLPTLRRLRPHARIVLDTHNVESDFFLQLADRQRGLLRAIARHEWQAARRAEAALLSQVDAVVAISKDDADALSRLSGRPVTLVPQGVEPSWRWRPVQKGQQLCYVGNLGWHPNRRGLDWFVHQVWPLLRRLCPTATLAIAGSGLTGPAPWRGEGISVLGYLDDLEPLYQQSVAMIAPILDGSGVRIKLLEALRAGMPLLTTTPGAAGLPLRDDHEVLVRDGAAPFAQAAARLCQDATLRERLRHAGYQYLQAHHGAAAVAAAMRRALGLSSGTIRKNVEHAR